MCTHIASETEDAPCQEFMLWGIVFRAGQYTVNVVSPQYFDETIIILFTFYNTAIQYTIRTILHKDLFEKLLFKAEINSNTEH